MTARTIARLVTFGFAVLLAAGEAAARVPEGFSDRVVVQGLNSPVGMAFLPDGRLLVIEQHTWRIRLVIDGAIVTPDPLVVVSGSTNNGERGLLGIAVDPRWPASPYLYVHVTSTGSRISVSRFTVTGDLAFISDGSLAIDPASRFDLINTIPDNATNHNGGTVRFGPDGMLYVSLGEDANACAAQDTSSLRGVILRLDVTRLPAGPGGPPDPALITPADNPFVAAGSPRKKLIWAFGLRNPFRFHIDAPTGDLFIADVGQDTWEEISWGTGTAHDFGWPITEGFANTGSHCPPGGPLTAPIYAFDHSVNGGQAVISGGVYRAPIGSTHPFPAEYAGDYFFSDYYSGILRRLKRTGSMWAIAPEVTGQPSPVNWGDGFGLVSDFAVGPDGSLWYCKQGGGAAGLGEIRRLVHAAGPDTQPPPPVFLSPRPVPAPGFVDLHYTLPRIARVDILVYDIRGRLVRRVVSSRVDGPGPHFERWDGRDDDGHDVRPGLYFARVIVDGVTAEQRVPLIR